LKLTNGVGWSRSARDLVNCIWRSGIWLRECDSVISVNLCFIFLCKWDEHYSLRKLGCLKAKGPPIWRTAKMKINAVMSASLLRRSFILSIPSAAETQRSELSRHTYLQSRQLDSDCPAIASLSKQEFVTWELGKCNYFSTLCDVSCISRYLVAVPVQLRTFKPYVVHMLTVLEESEATFFIVQTYERKQMVCKA
jgi:hypothetical protein